MRCIPYQVVAKAIAVRARAEGFRILQYSTGYSISEDCNILQIGYVNPYGQPITSIYRVSGFRVFSEVVPMVLKDMGGLHYVDDRQS